MFLKSTEVKISDTKHHIAINLDTHFFLIEDKSHFQKWVKCTESTKNNHFGGWGRTYNIEGYNT